MNWQPKKKVVVPIDFSDESFHALEIALDMVTDPEHVDMLHVLQDISPAEPGVVWGVVDKKSRVEHVKKTFDDRLSDEKQRRVGIHVTFGDPGQEIVDFAEKSGAELIVMPSSGRTGISRLLIGSVAERVVRLAHCPVLVLRR
jgi:nucleotide-binding universal stress UspA family protein